MTGTVALIKPDKRLCRTRIFKELYDFIKSQSTELTEFDESLVKRMIERIVVYDDKVCVEFKSGMVVEI